MGGEKVSLPVCPNPACAEIAAYDAHYCLECGTKLGLDLRPLSRYECLMAELSDSAGHGERGEPVTASTVRRMKHSAVLDPGSTPGSVPRDSRESRRSKSLPVAPAGSMYSALLGEAAQTAEGKAV